MILPVVAGVTVDGCCKHGHGLGVLPLLKQLDTLLWNNTHTRRHTGEQVCVVPGEQVCVVPGEQVCVLYQVSRCVLYQVSMCVLYQVSMCVLYQVSVVPGELPVSEAPFCLAGSVVSTCCYTHTPIWSSSSSPSSSSLSSSVCLGVCV